MRQAGVLAAAGIIAIQKMAARLGEDHLRARKLAEGLAGIPGVCLDQPIPATNMVFFTLSPEVRCSADEIAAQLIPYGVLVYSASARRFRLVTHHDVDDTGIERALTAFRAVLSAN